MEIVTGHRGTPHITPYKVRDFNIGTVGAEDYVINAGSELEAQLVSNNRIDIKDGSICMQGMHAVIPKNINDELTIENGIQGEKRIDLIVARYEKVADSGVESVNTVVLQGTPSKETPNVPGHVVGDIRNGDLKHEMPLYEVELDGINITEVRPVFKKLVSAAEQQKMIESLNGKIELQMTPSSGMRFSTQWNDNYAIVKGDILYINFLVEKTNGAYFKENTPHTLCKIKKPKSVKIGNRLSLAGYALSQGGSGRANSGQVSLYTGTSDGEELSVSFLTTDTATYKMNVTGALLLR